MTRKSKLTGLGIALGAALGTAFGVVAGNVGAWLAVGVAIGVALGVRFQRNPAACPQCAELHRSLDTERITK